MNIFAATTHNTEKDNRSYSKEQSNSLIELCMNPKLYIVISLLELHAPINTA
jgi:hypothetical protein